MAFDGITVAAIVAELNRECLGGRVSKVAQPEKDELLLTIKSETGNHRLILSANPSLPLVYLTDENKLSPAVAPAFTMLLRKHIQNGRIISISQPGLERIIVFEIEHMDEMGDMGRKYLYVELMGKYSNIILVDSDNQVVDSIRRIGANVSSVREVLPGREYFIPSQEGKLNIVRTDDISEEDFSDRICANSIEVSKAIYQCFVGISPMIAAELADESHIEARGTSELSREELHRLYTAFTGLLNRIEKKDFTPVLLYENDRLKEYAVVPCASYKQCETVTGVSQMLIHYYHEKEAASRAKQRNADLRKIVTTIIERDVKKLDIWEKQLKDTEKKDKFRIYGELLNTYGYSAKPGDKSITVTNYYDGEELTIPLDPDLSSTDNAKRYFDKYNKLKRTQAAISELQKEVTSEVEHLQSVLSSLQFVSNDEELSEIREELAALGYVKRKNSKIKNRFKSKPLHYISSDGFHMYVGKNNFQNDELTFKFAAGNDWWFHAKKIPGSHVILKSEDRQIPDRTFEEAARLAAHFSKGMDESGDGKIEVDYVNVREVKKPNGSKPGFVVYYTNYSMVIDGDISNLTPVD